MFIYAIGGISLMVLVGYTGLVSLGHAAFLGIGAYAHAFFLQHGVPWVASVVLAVLITTASGLVVGLPALRMTGIYLAIATLAFAVIIQEVFSRWESVTHGFAGMPVAKPVIFGVPFEDDRSFYYLCLFFLVLALWLTRNLLRSPTGRAWIAIRDSEIAAQSMGVNLAIYKSMAFAYSAGADGAGRRAVRAQDRLSGARHLHHPAVDPVPAAGDRGRAGLAARRGVRRDLRGPAAAGHRHPARFDPRQHGRRGVEHRHRGDRRGGRS